MDSNRILSNFGIWFKTLKIHFKVYLMVLSLAGIFYLIALYTVNFTHEIFTNLFANFVAIFFTLVIVEQLLKIPQKRIKKLFHSDIERLNFNFNYFLSSIKGFEDVEYDIFLQRSPIKNDSFLEFIDKSNSVLLTLNGKEIEDRFMAISANDERNFLNGIKELIVIVDKATNNYKNIFEVAELAYLLEIKQNLDWVKTDLEILLNNKLEDKKPIIEAISINICDLIKKITELYKIR